MSDSRTAHSPIVIDRVERSRGDGDTVRLRLAGRRLAVAAGPELDLLLVVALHGQRHRFAPSKTGDEDPAPGSWQSSFTVPDWAVPLEPGRASLWVGQASVPVPPVGTRIRTPQPARTTGDEDPSEAEAEAGRAGPLADALLRETVSALHAELEQRSSREAALNGALERARAELVARTASQTELEATQGELRTELARLVEAVAEQQAEFERRLGEAQERSEAELAQARREADHARAELAQARREADHARAELAQHQVRAQEAASLREQLAITAISRDAAVAEAAGLRAELSRLGAELAVTREQAGDSELGAAQQLLEDARALTAQLRQQSRS